MLLGEALANCRIERHSQAQVDAGEEPYVVRFEMSGREYLVALAVFQARTQPVSGVTLACARAEGAS